MKIIKLLVVFLGISFTVYSQSPNHIYQLQGFDQAHYSIENYQYEGGQGYLCAGTLFDKKNKTQSHLHLLKLRIDGSIEWEVQLETISKALDVTFNSSTGEIAVTGTIAYENVEVMFVSFFDFTTGALIESLGIPSYDSNGKLLNGAGTNLIYDKNRNVYIVGGYCYNFNIPLEVEKGILLEIEPIGSNHYMIIYKELSSNILPNAYYHINDITPINSGYFITGSYGTDCGSGISANLAVIVDYNLDLAFDLSFQETFRAINQIHFGVSSVYDEEKDKIFMMSYNYGGKSPYISVFKNVSNTPALDKQYHLPIIPSIYDKPGFQLIQDPNNSKRLIAAGYELTLTQTGGINTETWLLSFNKNTGLGKAFMKRRTPQAINFGTLTQGMLSPFWLLGGGGAFHPEIITTKVPDKTAGFVFVNPIGIVQGMTTQYSLNLMSINDIGTPSHCLQQKTYADTDDNTIYCTTAAVMIKDIDLGVFDIDPGLNRLKSYDDDNGCEGRSRFSNSNLGELIDKDKTKLNLNNMSLVVSPNPSKGNINVTLKNKILSGQLYLINTLGETLYLSEGLEGENIDLDIDLSHLAKGIYFLRYSDEENEMIKKVIKL